MKKVKRKAWALVNKKSEETYVVYTRKDYARAAKGFEDKIVPCTITYTIPKK